MPSANILIIEDESITSMGIKNKLERLGYTVSGIETSGNDAIKKAGELNPDLILMDIVLKGEIDGINAAKKINQRFSIPIVYLTAYFDNETLKRAKLTNPGGYITKPFSDSDLKSTIETALYNHGLEKKLKESEELYRNLFKYSLNGVALHEIVTDDKGHPVDYIFLDVNPAFEKLTGLRSEDIIGERVTHILPDITKTSLIEKYGDVALKGNSIHFEEYSPDLDKFYEISAFSPCKNQFAAVFSDITKRKLDETTLKESKKKYKDLTELLPQIICESDKNGIITFCNPVTYELTGYSKEDFDKGLNISQMVIPEDKKRIKDNLKRIIHGENPTGREYTALKKDGSTFPINIYSSPIIQDGEFMGLRSLVIDITDIKNMELSLKKSKKKYKALIKASPEAVIVTNLDGIIDFVSPKTLDLGGFKNFEDILGKSAFEFIAPEYRQKAISDFHKTLNQGLSKNAEYKILKSDGSEYIGNLNASLIKNENDEIESVVCTLRDITKIKKAEDAIKKSESYYRTIFENTGTATLIVDEDSTISLINTEGEKLCGYKKEEVEGKISWKNFVLDDYIEKMEEYHHIRRINPDLPPRNYEFELVDKYGNIKDILLTVALIPQTKKSLVSLLDITDKKQSRRALFESEKKYRQLVENAHEGIWSIDSEGITTFVNPRMAEMLNYNIEEIIGKPIFSFIETKDIETAKKYIKRSADDIKGQNDIKFIKKDGSKIYTSIETSPILDEDGNTIGVLSLVADISKRKKTEKEIKASLKEKEILLKEIHHRVKNNLQIISSLLNLQTGYINDEDTLDVFKESQNRVKSMSMIHEKLYRSKSMVKIDFGEYVTDLTRNLFYNYKIDRSIIEYNTKIDNIFFDINTAIPCGLIINELVTNCLKHAFSDIEAQKSLYEPFTPTNTKNEITIELTPLDDEFALTVADNGIGFPDNTNFRNTKSLGLQLVNNLVEQLDGTIKLDKTNGTKFRIIFKELKYKERI
ncbi:MAG: PAS domain S-box protein [Methanobacterium sp.]|uniref:PAS domain S-box protein n=1 Tax=Methanobacterium sp. TaxID=2164 RepID=UPI003D64C097|nr:PAS domain S-box protein [Methanobacterium sp.]